eukprot:GHVL01018486.1.p1 GENE.GHVL01018486.1~~GHVL01018486.1.p1  ORF type:complete len:209 (-),score=24.98 GHVL01018486.1:101-727(-)
MNCSDKMDCKKTIKAVPSVLLDETATDDDVIETYSNECVENNVFSKNYPCFIDRYFSKYYKKDVYNQKGLDVYVYKHSNNILLLGIECHPCLENQILKVEFVSRIEENSVSGKRKRGAKELHVGSSIADVHYISHPGGIEEKIRIYCPIHGFLINYNERLLKNPDLLKKPDGWLIIVNVPLQKISNVLKDLLQESEYTKTAISSPRLR